MKRATWQRYKSARPSSPATVRGPAPETLTAPGDAGLTDYPGAKNAPGVWQTIINNIPPHETFVECFAGTAAITRHKLSATSTIVIESDGAVHRKLVTLFRSPNSTLIEQLAIADVGQHECQLGSVRLVLGCAVEWLRKNLASLARAVVYLDPPYLASTRAVPGRRYYRQEFSSVADHAELLDVIRSVESVSILISGRRSKLYDSLLEKWRRVDYQTRNHGHTVTESLWCNFPEPTQLHDYRWLGSGFRERERIKKKRERWRRRLAAMPVLERRVIAAAIAASGEAS